MIQYFLDFHPLVSTGVLCCETSGKRDEKPCRLHEEFNSVRVRSTRALLSLDLVEFFAGSEMRGTEY